MMMKEKVVDLETITERRGLVYNFVELAQNNFINLTKNILGDYSYSRKNRYSIENKLKILSYLKDKFMLIYTNLE